MDNTFNTIHPNQKIYNYGGSQDHFFLTKIFKKAADKKVKKFAAKTAAKSGLSDADKKAFVKHVTETAQPVTTKAARSATLFTLGALGTAGGFALAPLVGGAGAAGAAAGSSGAAATGGTIAAGGAAAVPVGKSLINKIKGSSDIIDKGTRAGNVVLKEYDKLPQSVKENLQQGAEKVLSNIKIGNGTAADLLPKTESQKILEASIQNNGLSVSTFSLSKWVTANIDTIIILAIVIVLIGIAVKTKQG